MFLYTDLSGIEARTLRWIAGCPSLLDFASYDKGGPDPYKATAARAFGISVNSITDEQRQVGKVLVLQCQYQSGWLKVKMTVPSVTDEFAKAAVEAFRKSHPKIVKLWSNLNDAFKSVLSGQRETVSLYSNRLQFSRFNKSTIGLRLPSGRSIYYNKCRILAKDIKISDTKTLRKGSIAYYKHDADDFTNEKQLTSYYGGLGSENVASGIARDIIALAMLKCEANSVLPLCHHAHDSAMSELPTAEAKEKLPLLSKILTTPPDWCKDIPLASPVKLTRRMP